MKRSIWGSWLVACLLVVPTVHAQTLAPVGTEGTFDVATWNIEWFGSSSNGPSDDERQLENVRDVMLESAIDLWAVQEIADADDFEALLAMLGSGWSGRLATQSGSQRIGFVYRTDIVQPLSVEHILTSFDDAFAGRPPLQLEANVTIGGTTRPLTFIVLHMKAFDDARSYDKRVEAARRLKNRIDFLMPNDPVVILGDLNDELRRSIRLGIESPYAPFVEDADAYRFLTLPLEDAGAGTYCSNSSCSSTGSFLDHILITDELFATYVDASAERLTAVSDRFAAYGSTTSDHLPVYARFDLGIVASAHRLEAPAAPQLALFPAPARDVLTVRFSTSSAGPARLDVIDLLGRTVRTVDLDGRNERDVRVAVADLPAGLYMLRIQSGTSSATRSFVKLD